MRPDDGEVLDALRTRGVRDVQRHADVVAHRAVLTLERTRQGRLGQLELERKRVAAAGHDGNVARLVVGFWGEENVVLVNSRIR